MPYDRDDRGRGRDRRDRDRDRSDFRRKRKRSRWGVAENTFASSLAALPKYVPGDLSIEMQECLALRSRVEELTKKISLNEIDMEWYTEREASPEPVYDSHGRRINTKDQRRKDNLNEERQMLVEIAYVMNPYFKPPADYTPLTTKKMKRIYIPIDEHPDYNFIGLIIGPRGNTQKEMEKETGCKIAIRGKGSIKDGKGRKDKGNLGDDDRLHVLLTADTDLQLQKAAKMVHRLLIPLEEGKNDHKRQQLRQLAELNGTLRDRMWMSEPSSFERAHVKCAICGELSHPTPDCPLKGKGGVVNLRPQQKEEMSSEYEKFLAEIGEAPAKGDAYDEYMASLASEDRKSVV